MKITGNLGLTQIFQRLFPDENLAGGEEKGDILRTSKREEKEQHRHASDDEQAGLSLRSDGQAMGAHPPSILTARAISIPTIVSESTASSIMSTFASLVSGYVSAGLNAVAPVKATNR
jgi:hypothetical protein